VSNPDADQIGGFLDVFYAFEVERVYVSGRHDSSAARRAIQRDQRQLGGDSAHLRHGVRPAWSAMPRRGRRSTAQWFVHEALRGHQRLETTHTI
jgi:hypothetical protein